MRDDGSTKADVQQYQRMSVGFATARCADAGVRLALWLDHNALMGMIGYRGAMLGYSCRQLRILPRTCCIIEIFAHGSRG